MKSKSERRNHTLYITHGGLVTVNALSRHINPESYHWIIKFDKGAYEFVPKHMNVDVGIDLSALKFIDYKLLIEFIKDYTRNIECICMDANLTHPSSPELSFVTHNIISLSETKSCVLFSENEFCINEAIDYFRFKHELSPPKSLRTFFAGTRAEISKQIIFEKINLYKRWECYTVCPSRLFSFFSDAKIEDEAQINKYKIN